MGFIAPAAPPVDMEEWKKLPHLQRIKPLAQDWALNGVGAPAVVYLLYIVKLLIFAVGGALVISASTAGLGGLGNLSHWWTETIVFQKVVVWTMLWEIIGLGAGSMPLTFRFVPPSAHPLLAASRHDSACRRFPPVPLTVDRGARCWTWLCTPACSAPAIFLLLPTADSGPARRPAAWIPPRSACCSSSSRCWPPRQGVLSVRSP